MKNNQVRITLRSIVLILLLAFFVNGLKHSKKLTEITHQNERSKHNQQKETLQKLETDFPTKDDEDSKESGEENSDELENSKKKTEQSSEIEEAKKNNNEGQSEEVGSEEEKQKDEQNKGETEDSEEETVQAVKLKRKQKSKSQHFQKEEENNKLKDDQNSERGYLLYFAIYAFILIVISLIIKIKAQESFAAALIDRFLDLTWYGIVKNYFNKSQGYDAPSYDEDDKNNEHIDNGDSVTIGYSENQGRDLFWEKNSVEGI